VLRVPASHRLRSIRSWILVAAVAVAACGAATQGTDRQVPVPQAIAAIIHDLESRPVANPPAYVASYDYAGQVVYYVPPRCCDVFGDLYDVGGHVMCHPDGGLAGTGDGRCPDFLTQRKNGAILWRDTRKP
jgi:hypothetical protein